ncbi:WD40-repeat-containing domain protein [Cercophora scortea]|uniref:WD40-repeat-containing domain protein n=1 Tax=Cercophora scortea TaxID=314031 RepID=A0AAE0M9B2_9PEZI|nr:WD40-repeat-containing domain protein [Cercophora scortea]
MAPVQVPKAPAESGEWELPKYRASFTFEEDWKNSANVEKGEFFDIKFYPYSPVGAPPVFAAVSKEFVVVCRLNQVFERDKGPCEVLRVIRDGDEEAANCTCCWTKDPETGRAWLCIAGADAKVKIYNIVEGKLVKTLVGHGGGINDLATSPANPWIIASASDDTTVRIWSLAPAHVQQPCVCLLGGEGHSWDLLSVAFHDTGRHVLSAGHDQVINLWTIPDLPTEHVDVPIVIHYPQFSTSEVHNNLVDCVAFYGDLILSRACHEDTIVLWRIEGFHSDDPPLLPSQAPTTYDTSKQTRSAFTPTLSPSRPAHFTRLLQFYTPDCASQFYMRFKVFHAPDKHPILAFCNAKSKTMFWDIARFGAYDHYLAGLRAATKPGGPPPPVKPTWLTVKRKKKDNVSTLRNLAEGDKDSLVSASPDPETMFTLGGFTQDTLAEWANLYDASNSHGILNPHKMVPIDGTANFVGRQVAWSPEGDWCVVVGNHNRALIYQRWPKDGKASTPA